MGYNLTKIFSAKRLCTTQHAVLFTPVISLRNKVVIELEEYFDKICIKETNSIFQKYLPSSSIRDLEKKRTLIKGGNETTNFKP